LNLHGVICAVGIGLAKWREVAWLKVSAAEQRFPPLGSMTPFTTVWARFRPPGADLMGPDCEPNA
jgi:hypothetical protein